MPFWSRPIFGDLPEGGACFFRAPAAFVVGVVDVGVEDERLVGTVVGSATTVAGDEALVRARAAVDGRIDAAGMLSGECFETARDMGAMGFETTDEGGFETVAERGAEFRNRAARSINPTPVPASPRTTTVSRINRPRRPGAAASPSRSADGARSPGPCAAPPSAAAAFAVGRASLVEIRS